MVAFVASTVLTAANLNTAFNALTIRTVILTSDTLVLADNGGAVTYSNASATTSTIPPNSSVAYATGTKIVLVNLGAGVVTVTAGSGVTVNGTLTISQNAGGTCIKTATNTWSFLPFSSGTAAAVITSSTGSPTITTDGTATVYKFTGDGTLVVGTAGTVRLLVCAGGGGGTGTFSAESAAGGGAGGYAEITSLTLEAATWTIKVGAGGTGGITATDTSGTVGTYSAISSGQKNVSTLGGGPGKLYITYQAATISNGASGGGGNYTATAAGASTIATQGFAGGNGGAASVYYQAGGGGGATAAGTAGNSASLTGAAGGAGAGSDIVTAATTLYYSGGGGAGKASNASATAGAGGSGVGGAGGTNGAGNPGTTNRGGGGGGGGLTGANNGGAGGSGVVIVRVG